MGDHQRVAPDKAKIRNQVDLIREIIFKIRRLMQAGELYTKELGRKYQVSVPQLLCLLTLDEQGPLPTSQIARIIMVNSSTVTGIIDRLEQKRLVERSRTSTDRRVVTVSLTEAGKQLAQNAPPPIQEKLMEGLKTLSRSELEEVVRGLTTLTGLLDVRDLAVREF